MNRVILNEANKIVNRCNVLGIFFREAEDTVFDEMCGVVKDD